MTIGTQLAWLFILAIPVACISWTFTHEEVVREPREFCIRCSKERKTLFGRKFFYVFTCEYCFSHYVAAALLFLMDFKMLTGDWRGYIIAGFSLVWIANCYMSIYNRIRINLRKESTEAALRQKELEE